MLRTLNIFWVVIWCFQVSAGTWYVRPTAQGGADGTAYADAWGGIHNINWTSVQDGDTVYVCGTNIFTVTGINQYYNTGISTIGRSSITIRGDYTGDPCVMLGGVLDTYDTIEWGGPDANGVYWSTNYIAAALRFAFAEVNSGVITPYTWQFSSTWEGGLGGAFCNGGTNFIKTTTGEAPSTNVAFYDGGYLWNLNQKTNITFRDMLVYGSAWQQNGDGWRGTSGSGYTDGPKAVTFQDVDTLYGGRWVLYKGMDNWTFTGCEIGYVSFGIYAYMTLGNKGPDALTVTNCYIHDCRAMPYANQDNHGIGFQAGSNAFFVRNRVENCYGIAIDLYSGGNEMTNCVVDGNSISNIFGIINSGTGIGVDSGLPYTAGYQAGLRISNNAITRVGQNATYGWNGIGINTLDEVEIENNTIAWAGNGISIASGTSPTLAIIKNNLVYNPTNSFVKTTGTGTPVVDMDYNLFYADSGPSTPYSLSPSFAHDSNGITGEDPLLSEALRLLPTSPAIHAGVGVGLTYDAAGRAWANPPSIGAYEFGASAAATTAHATTLK